MHSFKQILNKIQMNWKHLENFNYFELETKHYKAKVQVLLNHWNLLFQKSDEALNLTV